VKLEKNTDQNLKVTEAPSLKVKVSDEILESYSGMNSIVCRASDGTMSRCYSKNC
jgi:hypothetical protein